MAAARLTPNAVTAALAGDTNLKPVVQIVDLRSISLSGPNATPRFRAIISDGVATTPALFASQLCDLARSGIVRRGAIAQLLEYIINEVHGRRSLSLSLSLALSLTRLDLRALWWGSATSA
jgi:replication factor A1